MASESAKEIPGTGLLWFSDLVTERNKTFPLFLVKCGTIHNNNKKSRC